MRRVLDGRFELIRRLGRGGMAIVYEAYDRQAQRLSAIKILRPEFSRPQDLVRFKREYRTALRLRHPSCVEVYDQRLLPDRWFYSMRLYSRGSLARARRPLGAPAVIRIGLQVLSALDYVHARNVVHRDVKPHNILVGDSEYQRVALADFGIAQVADLDEHFLASGAFGSPRYVAPETLEHGVADPRADLYALGVVLYELLSGRHPFESAFSIPGEWRQRLQRFVAEPLTSVVPDVSHALDSLVMRLMGKDVERRPRTAALALEELSEIAGGEPVRTTLPRPVSMPYLSAAPLVGRETEVALGRRFVRDALNGDRCSGPVLLAVTGAAGSGKSRLLSAIAKEAVFAGATVLRGQCREETGAPFQELRSVVDYLAGAAPLQATFTTALTARDFGADGGLARSAEAAVATLEEEAEAFRQSDADAAQRFTTRRAVERLLARAQTNAVVIVVEDIQWMGSASAQLLAAWVRAVAVTQRQGRPARVAFIVTQRAATDSVLGELDTELRAVERLEVLALREEEAARLVAALLGRTLDVSIEAFSREVFREPGCTPLFVRQVMQLLLSKDILHDRARRWDGQWRLDASQLSSADLPMTLRQAIGDRAARLSVETQVVLSMAAVGGRRFRLPVLCAALGKDEELIVDCLDEAERANLVTQDAVSDHDYVFVHDRYRDSIYEHLATSERREHHLRWAEAFVVLHGRDRELLPDLAHHFAAAEKHAKAYEFAVMAADAAQHDGAFTQAAEMYRRAESEAQAAGLPVESSVLERHGDACMNAGLYVEAQERYRERLIECRGNHRDAVLVKLASLQFRGAMERALDVSAIFPAVQEAMEQLGLGPPRSRIALMARAIVDGLVLSAWIVAPPLRPNRGASDAERLEILLNASIVGFEVSYFFEPALIRYYSARAAVLATRLNHSALALATLCFGASFFGSDALARRFAARVNELEPKAATTPERAFERLLLGVSLYTCGELEAAELQLMRAHAVIEYSGEPVHQAMLLAILSLLLIHRGDTERARQLGRRMVERGELLGVASFTAQGRATVSIASYYDGDYDSAAEWADGLLRETRMDPFSESARALIAGFSRLDSERGADVEPVQRAIDRWQDQGFVALNLSLAMIAAAACVRSALRANSADSAFVGWLSKVCRRERLVATRLAAQKSMYLAVVAARDALLGRRRKATRGFQRALRVAHRLGVVGDVRVIQRLSGSLEEASYL